MLIGETCLHWHCPAIDNLFLPKALLSGLGRHLSCEPGWCVCAESSQTMARSPASLFWMKMLLLSWLLSQGTSRFVLLVSSPGGLNTDTLQGMAGLMAVVSPQFCFVSIKDAWKCDIRNRRERKLPQRCSSFEAIQRRQGNISLHGNYYCLDPISGSNFLRGTNHLERSFRKTAVKK